MKALLLNGIGNSHSIHQNVESIVEKSFMQLGFRVESVKLCDLNIKRCRGCFGCWVKTPGECLIGDDSRQVCRKIINSDYVIFLTPIVFGGYSSHLKKAIDKIIPLISPFFANYHGETHHYPRYNQYPSIIGIGLQNNYDYEEALCFKNIVMRNAINFHSPNAYAEVFLIGDDESLIRNRIVNLIEKHGIQKGTFVNC